MKILLPGHVVPKARPRFDGKRAYTSTRYREWLDEAIIRLRNSMKLAGAESTTEPQRLVVHVAREHTLIELTPVHGGRPKGVRGDIDNIVGSVMDALQQAGVYGNDSQVHQLEVRFIND